MFEYKTGFNRQWPLLHVFNESYKTLTTIFTSIKRTGGIHSYAKQQILKKVNEIRANWERPDGLPRKLRIPYTRKKIHFEPDHLMEFRDKDNCRRFFRLRDQLRVASNEYLEFLQSQLSDQVAEESAFYGILQRQIEFNNDREKDSRRPSKRRK